MFMYVYYMYVKEMKYQNLCKDTYSYVCQIHTEYFSRGHNIKVWQNMFIHDLQPQ
jgi:hypothetical protein